MIKMKGVNRGRVRLLEDWEGSFIPNFVNLESSSELTYSPSKCWKTRPAQENGDLVEGAIWVRHSIQSILSILGAPPR